MIILNKKLNEKARTANMGFYASALVRVRNKLRRPDARIAFAMPPRIGTNIMMVMREDMHHGARKEQKLRLFLYKFLFSYLLIKPGPYNV
jgi:hypothetical protein